MNIYKKVLLVDDDSITNFINSSAIKKAGCAAIVKIVLNGEEALNYIKNDCREENLYPDLIFVDINMPVMDGFEFVVELKKLNIEALSDTQLVILTTSSSPKDIEKSKMMGLKMIRKPLTKQIIEEFSVKIKLNQ